MGQQQLLLIILGVIIVGVAIAVGISMFSSQSVASNKDAIISDINNLAADAYQFKIRPISMGGGGGTYTGGSGYVVKTLGPWGTGNPNATYVGTVAAASVTIVATSKTVASSTVSTVVDANGGVGTLTYTGEFTN